MRWSQMMKRIAYILVMGLAFSACSGSEGKAKAGDGGTTAPAFTRDEADSVIPVTATGFSFQGIPPTLTGPKVFFEVKNDASLYHEFSVIGAVDGKESGLIEPLAGGETKSIALELPPGNYIARCMMKLVDTPHADVGMLSRFTVE